MDSAFLTLDDARGLLNRRELSSVELTRSYLERIESNDRAIGAYLTVTPDLALLQAEQADSRLATGEAGPLTGLPMAVKDILSTKGVPTTCGSRILERYVPQYTATAVRLLEEAGAVMLGKTNMDEFAMGSSTENSGFFPTRNPWDTERVPGGSSGGSAAAVAAGEAVFALGTDTGGSVRQPAAHTGTVGLKPTYGRVSRFGLVAFGSSLDQVGPIACSVRGVAEVLAAIAGPDPRDATSANVGVPDYVSALDEGIDGLRIGVPAQYFVGGIEPGVERSIREALDVFSSLGASIREVSLPHTDAALDTYYIIAPAEAMANLARYDGVRYGLSVPGDDIWQMFAKTREAGFGREVKRRILIGAYALSAGYYDAYYKKAQQVRSLVRGDFEAVFREVDVLVTPTTPSVAFRLGEKADNPLEMYLSDVFTVPSNIAGNCAVSLPGGFIEGLPVGLQIIGSHFDEATILRAAHAFEQATEWRSRHPSLAASASEAVLR